MQFSLKFWEVHSWRISIERYFRSFNYSVQYDLHLQKQVSLFPYLQVHLLCVYSQGSWKICTDGLEPDKYKNAYKYRSIMFSLLISIQSVSTVGRDRTEWRLTFLRICPLRSTIRPRWVFLHEIIGKWFYIKTPTKGFWGLQL